MTRSSFRALALATVGGLLLLAPATSVSATSPIQFAILQPDEVQGPSLKLSFREAKASQMTLVDALRDDHWFVTPIFVPPHVTPGPGKAPATYAIDDGGRYDGKQVPI